MEKQLTVFLASSNKEDRQKLFDLQQALVSEGLFVFTPCLAFQGDFKWHEDHKSVSHEISLVCEAMLKFCDILIAFYNGYPSIGMWRELERMKQLEKPVCVLDSRAHVVSSTSLIDVPVFKDLEEVMAFLGFWKGYKKSMTKRSPDEGEGKKE